MKMKIGAIVQARMSSQRLPNKVLHEVAGKPVLQYLLERLTYCDHLDEIIVATSVEDSDQPIADFCHRNNVKYYRGPLSDVAGRFDKVLDKYKFDAFVRVNGDSPLLDQRLIEQGISLFLDGDYDLVTNIMPRTFPKGQSVEVLRTKTFKRTYRRMREKEDLEHVTRYYYQHIEEFHIKNFTLKENLNYIGLSVDTPEDLDNFVMILSNMKKPHWEYSLDDILMIYRSLMPAETERR